MTRNLSVSPARIAEDISDLAAITEPDHPWTRRSFTPMFLAGREYLVRRFEAAGLETRIDAAGNLIGRRAGNKPGLGTIMIGSHSDTVPDGGRFDGIAGVSAALEVARALADQHIALDHDLEIIDFLAEEVSAFGISCVGSRGMASQLKPEMLAREVDARTLGAGIAEAGGDPTRLGEPVRTDGKAFLELHIEQGTVLEEAREDIGVVTAIAGITRIEIIVEGRADHAGTTRMGHRLDALAAAARLVLGIEALATERAKGPTHFAATVGEFEIEPNAANVIPSRARLLIDARAEVRPDMLAFVGDVAALARTVAAETGVGIPASGYHLRQFANTGGRRCAEYPRRRRGRCRGPPSSHGVRRRPRHGLDGAHLQGGDDLHPLPRWPEPFAGRVGGKRRHRAWCGGAAGGGGEIGRGAGIGPKAAARR